MTADTLTKLLGALLFAQHALRLVLVNTSPPSADDLEAYQFSLSSLAKSSQRIMLIRLTSIYPFAPLSYCLRRRVRWSLYEVVFHYTS